MKNHKSLLLTLLMLVSLGLTSCLHIVEEVTFHNKGNGSYKMNLDMSEMKGMMDMLKGMETDSAAVAEGEEAPAEEDNSMAQMGSEISGVASTLKTIQGITNVVEVNDTSNFQFGYTFDFNSVETLNKALKVINKEKYDSKVEEIYKFNGKSFERLAQGDMGEEIKKALAEGEDAEGGEESMEMVKMFFADMTYKQVYHFPDRQVKKSSNGLSELSDDNHTLTITLKPFDEEQMKSKATVSTEVKLK